MKNIIKDLKNVFFMIIFTLAYSYIFGGKFSLDDAIGVVLVFNFSVYICGTIVSYKFNLKYTDSLHQNLILAFLGIGIVAFAYLYAVRHGLDANNYAEDIMRMNAIFSLYESMCLIYAIKRYKVNLNYKKEFFKALVVSIFISYLCINCKYGIFTDIGNGSSLISLIVRLINIGTKIYLLKSLYDIRSDISTNIFTYLRTFIIIRTIVHISSFIDNIDTNALLIILILIIEYIGHYCIFRITVTEIIRNPYSNIYNDLVEKSESLKDTSRQLSEICEENEVLSNNYEKAKRDQEIKNELLTNISHEFKTPVNVIYSAIQMQDVLKSEGNIEDILKYNSIIKQNCNRLIKLINNFIDTTRLKKNSINYNLEYFNIVNLTENIVISVIPFAKSKNLNIVFDTSDEEMYAKVDEQLFDRLILNLLSNAIKYSKETGDIRVSLFNENNNAEIVIKDEGIGIGEENFKVIFSRFERVDQTFSRNTEGSGLGLSIVKEITNIFNGDIRIESKLGEGTTVKIILPLVNDIDEVYKERGYENSNSSINHQREVEIEMSDIYL